MVGYSVQLGLSDSGGYPSDRLYMVGYSDPFESIQTDRSISHAKNKITGRSIPFSVLGLG